MSQDTTNSTESSSKEIKTKNTDHEEIAERMEGAGFGDCKLGCLPFVVNSKNREDKGNPNSNNSTTSDTGTSGAISYDQNDIKVVDLKNFVPPILEGPKVSVKEGKRKANKEKEEKETDTPEKGE